ncbi:hypothetical protein SAMN05443665_10404 [Actinomadura meyerae]|uniref:Uncharacterized protein n=1 Tax=Actinomadura meyerae TaxID=240840 RepID=A0A239NFB6_9ACTN|nr:hypothetical protein [Actinomadura meyerae]SNT53212.1 hypothetical protein SAMN05443665_10404 [Actinomadura meyerae]
MAWTGEGEGELNVMYCQGGSWVDPPPYIPVFDRATKRTLSTRFWDRYWIAYTGEDEHLYLARVAP